MAGFYLEKIFFVCGGGGGGSMGGAHSEREDFAKSDTERCNRPISYENACTFEFLAVA